MKERKKVDVSELRKVAVEYRSDVDVWKVAQEAESLYKAVKLLGIKNVSTVSDHVLRTGDQMSKRVRALSAYIMMHKLQMSDSALSVKRLENHYGGISMEITLGYRLGMNRVVKSGQLKK